MWSTTYNAWHLCTAKTISNGGVSQTWHLTAGWHTLEIHGRETDARLDRFVIDTNAAAPGGDGGSESVTYETFEYTFGAGELLGSSSGTVNSITATAENIDGTSPASDALQITYDNAASTPATPDLDSASDTGTSNTDDLTKDTTATFYGAAGAVEGSSTVTLRVGGADTRSATANADGSYTITLLAGDLAEGANAVDIYYVDAAGNTSADSANLSVTLDTTSDAAPAVAPDLAAASDTGLDDTDNITNDVSPTFSAPAGTVPASSTVYLRVGAAIVDSATAGPDGSYSITLPDGLLAEGNNAIDITYLDPAGNTSADSADLTVQLDTISSQPGAVDLTSDGVNDTGSSQVDNITNNKNCEISGTAEHDGTVHIYVNGTEVDTVASDAAGDWSYSFVDGDLVEGNNSVSVSVEDSLANPEGQRSSALTITLDRILATPGSPDLRAASDSGSSNIDNITSDTTAWFDGYAEPDVTVQLFVGVVGKGTTTTNAATGAWSIQLNVGDLASGANTVTVQATDAAGNTATSPGLTVVYDGGGTQPNAPKLTTADDSGTSGADGITNISVPTVYGSVAAGNPVEGQATVHVRTNKNAAGWVEVGTTVADSAGNWSYKFDGVDDLAVGTNLVDIYVTDLSNNDSADSDDLTIVLDTSATAPAGAPDLQAASDTGSSNSDNISNDTTPTFTGLAGAVEANATVWLRVDGSPLRSTTAAGDGSYSVTLLVGDVVEGANIIDIISIDPAGNTSTDSANLTFTLDTTAAAPAAGPVLDSASDTGTSNADNLTNDTTATFTGLANAVAPSSVVYFRIGGVNTRTTTAAADGSYSVTLLAGDLAEGANSVDIYYVDPAGNTSADSADLTVTLDTTVGVPALPDLTAASDTGVSSSDDITDEIRPAIQGLAGAVEANSSVQIWLDTPGAPDTLVDTVTAAADGSWNYTFADTPLEEGNNLIHVLAVDPAGNTSAGSANLTITIDFEVGSELAPDLEAASDTGTVNTDNITSDSTATISGDCPNNGTVKIRTNESTIVTFVDNDGTDDDPVLGQWAYTYAPGDLVEGSNTIDFLTIDTDNNTTTWSQDLVLTLDTTIEKPSLPDLTTADDTGSNNADDITNQTAPTITGTAEATATVTININAGAHIDTAVVNADGTWSYAVTNGWLNENANAIYVTATDTAGNTSVASNTLTITLDTTIGVPSAPDLTAATDTGVSSIDNTTSHANPRIIGTADPNTTIAIRLDPAGACTTLGTTTADGGGNWSYIFAGGVLAEGANDLDVLVTDNAGNTADSAELTVTIETAISAPASLDLIAASDLGQSNSDNITSLDTASITGSADASCTIHLRANGREVGTTTSNGAGSWTYTFDGVDDLLEGTNIIDAYAIDGVGNVSAYSGDLIVTLDTSVATPAAPDLELASDSGANATDNYTNVATATIAGTCEVGATVIIHVNGNNTFDTAVDADTDGIWSYTFAGGLLAAETGTANTIKVAQQDVAGNVSVYGSALTLTLDDSAATPAQPDLLAVSDTGDSDTDNLTCQANVTLTGTVEASSSLQLFIDQGSGSVLVDTISELLIDSGSWTYTLSTGQLAQGSNDITVVATDKAGNVSSASAALTVTFDTTIAQPSLPDLVDASDTGDFNNDEVTSDETPTFSGVADPNTHVTIRVDGDPINTVDADAAGNWTYTFALAEIQTGIHRVDVTAVDAAGNTSVPSDNLTIWLNVQPTQPASPNLKTDSDSGAIQTDNITNIKTPTIDGKADPSNTVSVYVDAALVGSAVADVDGFWEYTFTAGVLQEGVNAITIITEDSSGLQSSTSYPLEIDIDTTSPESPLPDLQAASDTGINNTDNRTSDDTPTIQGLTEPSALIDLYHNDEFVTQIPASATGTWTYTFTPATLTDGDNLVYIIITDEAGNLSDPSPILTIVLDAEQQSPDTPTVDPETDTGTSNTDALTNDTTSIITGHVKPDSILDILVSGETVTSIQADGNGDWQYQFESGQLDEGPNHIEVISTDPAGNIARSATLELTLDTIAPIVYNHFPQGTCTHTTSNIELYINNDDIDSAAASDLTGYILLGSGGDGTFADGNEWTIPITAVNVDTLSGLVQLLTAITLTDDTYQLTIDPDTSLRDLAGNPAQLNIAGDHSDTLTSAPDYAALTLTFEIDTAGPPAPSTPSLDADSDSWHLSG